MNSEIEYTNEMAEYINNVSGQITSENYNEIDTLILSKVAYLKFENVTWTKDELENGISLQEFANRILENSEAFSTNEKKDQEALLRAIADPQNVRYANCTVTNLAACNGNEMWYSGHSSNLSDESQWAAVTVNMNDGSNTSIVSFRGTDTSALGWTEDAEIGFVDGGTSAQRLSRDYLEAVASTSDHIIPGGHSKGGNDASAGYMMSKKWVRDKIDAVYNYDGPGHRKELRDHYSEAYKELEGKQVNIASKDSLIGQPFKSPGKCKYTDYDLAGHYEKEEDLNNILNAHNGYTWKINAEGTGFEKDNQTEFSKLFNRVLDSSLTGLSPSEQDAVIQAVITLGVPSLIAGEMDEKTWNKILFDIYNHPFRSIEELWATLKFVHTLGDELVKEGFITCVGFVFPTVAEFMRDVKDMTGEVFRQFKEYAENAWERVWNFFTGNSEESLWDDTPVYDFNNHNQGTYASNVIVSTFFSIDLAGIRNDATIIKDISSSLIRISSEINAVEEEVSKISTLASSIVFGRLESRVKKNAEKVEQLAFALIEIMKKYLNTEDKIISIINTKVDGPYCDTSDKDLYNITDI